MDCGNFFIYLFISMGVSFCPTGILPFPFSALAAAWLALNFTKHWSNLLISGEHKVWSLTQSNIVGFLKSGVRIKSDGLETQSRLEQVVFDSCPMNSALEATRQTISLHLWCSWCNIPQCIISANLLEIWQVKILVFPPSTWLLGVKTSDATWKKVCSDLLVQSSWSI